MPDWVLLTRKGLLRVDYDVDQKKYVETPVDYPFVHLRDKCEFEKGLTVRDLCQYVINQPLLKEFLAQYCWCKEIDEFHAELDKEFDFHEMKVEFCWMAEVLRHKTSEPPELCLESRVHGVYPNGETHGLGAVPLGTYADCPVVLNEKVAFWEMGVSNPQFEGTKDLSLFNILTALYYEISYYGSPRDRDAMWEEVMEEAEEI